jgi:hypothetical protein
MTTLEVPQSEVIHLAIVAGLYLGVEVAMEKRTMAMSLLTNLSCTKHGCFLKAWRSPKRLVKEPKVPSPRFYFVDRVYSYP